MAGDTAGRHLDESILTCTSVKCGNVFCTRLDFAIIIYGINVTKIHKNPNRLPARHCNRRLPLKVTCSV